MRPIYLLILWLLVTSSTPAQDHPQQECSTEGLDANHPTLSMVKAASTTGWQCYSNGKCSSFQIHRGDSIEVAHADKGWTCGYVTSADGAGAEWIRSDDLSPVNADPNPPLSAWFGAWHGGEDLVHIQSSKSTGSLLISGTATWDGLNGNKHFGDIEGEVKPLGNKLHYSEGQGEYACAVDMTLIGDYILASDNQYCGGLNARFQGVWRRGNPLR